MNTTWRATLARWLFAAGAGLAVLLGATLTVVGFAAWIIGAAWLLAALLVGGTIVSFDHARRVERSRRHLTTILTHRLRTSLAHVQAFNEMLLLGHESSEEERREWLEIIGREVERLGLTVENVLLVLDGRRSHAYPIRRTLDLGALLEDVACACGADHAQVRFEHSPPAGVLVNADPVALRQALANLLFGLSRSCRPGGALSADLVARRGMAMIQLELMGDVGTPVALPTGEGAAERDGCPENSVDLEIAVARHIARAHGGRAVPFHERSRSGYRFELPLASA